MSRCDGMCLSEGEILHPSVASASGGRLIGFCHPTLPSQNNYNYSTVTLVQHPATIGEELSNFSFAPAPSPLFKACSACRNRPRNEPTQTRRCVLSSGFSLRTKLPWHCKTVTVVRGLHHPAPALPLFHFTPPRPLLPRHLDIREICTSGRVGAVRGPARGQGNPESGAVHCCWC